LTKVDGGKVKHPFFLTSFVLSGMKSSQKSKQGVEYAVYEPRPMNLGDDTPLLDQVFACQLNKRGELVPPVICHPADKDELIAYLLEIRNPSKKPDEIRAIKRPNYKAYPDPDSGHVVLISQVGSIAGVEVDLWKGSRKEFFPSALLKELASERNFYNYKPSTALSIFGGFRVIIDGEWVEISKEQLKVDYAGQNEGKHYLKFDGKEVEVDYYYGMLQQHPLDPDLPKSELDETAIYSDNVRKNIRRFAGEYGIPLHGEFQKDENPFGFLTGKTEVKAADPRGELPFETDDAVESRIHKQNGEYSFGRCHCKSPFHPAHSSEDQDRVDVAEASHSNNRLPLLYRQTSDSVYLRFDRHSLLSTALY
jgi:hypothetical protein